MTACWLAIEIGGTKLQVAVGTRPGSAWLAREESAVVPDHGATGILQSIAEMARPLIAKFEPVGAGLGFGGPVDSNSGCAVTSHQIKGWDGYPLRQWCQDQFDLPLALANDCDAAALAEALYGAGQGANRVFYVTVGTGVGGGLVVGGQLDGTDRPAMAEIGHLRYSLAATGTHNTVESLASGWGIAAYAERRAQEARSATDMASWSEAILTARGPAGIIETRQLAELARDGNPLARDAFDQATRTLGWAIAQAITLIAPEVVVVGGGVPLAGEDLFWQPLRNAIQVYVFPNMTNAFALRPAQLGKEVVLHGALALAVGEGRRRGGKEERRKGGKD